MAKLSLSAEQEVLRRWVEGRVWQGESLLGQWAQIRPYRFHSLTFFLVPMHVLSAATLQPRWLHWGELMLNDKDVEAKGSFYSKLPSQWGGGGRRSVLLGSRLGGCLINISLCY